MKVVPRVLIVDDNPGDIELCKMVLEASGRFPHVFSAPDGEDALQLFIDFEQSVADYPDHFPPTIVLLDINMPRMDGFAFLEAYEEIRDEVEAKGASPSIVLMVTSSSDPRDRERARKLGFVEGFVTKPPSLADVTAIAERFGSEL